jgi:hypothetical protein
MSRSSWPLRQSPEGTTPPPASGLRTASEGNAPLAPAHVLLLAPGAEQSANRLRSRLDSGARITVVEGECLPELILVDVAVLHADSVGLACGPLLRDPALGLPELVFVVDELWSPQDLALRSRGFRHIVCEETLADWLPSMLPQLVSLARARRVLLRACSEGSGPAGMSDVVRQSHGMKLHAAETTFRSVFMRSLLAEFGSRRQAAEQAGVPYRSFCEMLRKLGL